MASTRLAISILASALLSTGCDGSGIAGADGRIYAGGGYFGRAIALEGGTALVGAYNTDEAFVLTRSSSGEWQNTTRLQPDGFPDPGTGNSRGNTVVFGWTVDLEGDVAVVGAPIFASGSEALRARTFIYERSGDEWRQTAELRPPPASAGTVQGIFGLPATTSAGRVAVRIQASAAEDGNVADPAAVLVYRKSGGSWSLSARIVNPEPTAGDPLDNFGRDLVMDGGRLAAAAYAPSRILLFEEQPDGVWALSTTVSRPEGTDEYPFGAALALDGPVLTASSQTFRNPSQPANQIGAGAVAVWYESGGSWTFEGDLIPQGLTPRDAYGNAVDATSGPLGDRIAVSAATRGAAGAVFVWVRRGPGRWELEAELTPEGLGRGAAFGEDVAIDGDRLLAGAIFDRGERGGVYEFRLGPDGWEQVFF